MTETLNKVEKWAYPLKIGTAEATDPQQFYAALAKAKDGYYPLGANGLWHGGVHFDDDTGLVADRTEVRCIADGEVVAYRIDETYPKSDFGAIQAVYSTGFVLVKHRLEVPVPPTPATAPGAQPAAATQGPSLTFFSLYMHLLDWHTYSETPALGRPAFWGGGTHEVKATADDKVLGLRVRQAPRGKPGYETVLTVLPRGTVVETGEEDHGWLKVVSVTPADTNVAAGTGWVFKREMTAGGTSNSYVIGTAAKDEMNPPRKGLAVHASASQASTTTAILPVGTQVKIGNDGVRGKYQKLLEVISGEPVPPLTESNGILGYVWEGLLETKSEPAEKNIVHLMDRPFPIKAGTLIGHVGKYQNHSDPAPKNLLHIEVFSCEDVKAFTQQSKASAARLPIAERTIVKIPKGSKLITHTQGMNATNPPKSADPGKTTGYDFLIPVGVLESLPLEKKIKENLTMNGSTSTTYWWRLEGVLGDDQGNGVDGWFAEPDIALSRHSPFEWEGFEFIEETVSNVEHLAANFHELNLLTDSEKETFASKVSTSTSGPVKDRLYEMIDVDKNDRLTIFEIRSALEKPWFAYPISRLITKYESEWFYKKDKWDSLDSLMESSESSPNKSWMEEKLRIENLSWWDSLVGQHDIGDEKKVHHLNFVGLLGGFCSRRDRISMEMLKVANPTGSDTNHQSVLPYLNKYASIYKLERPREIAHFLSQVAHESGFRIVEEGLGFRALRMRAVYGCKTQNGVSGYDRELDSCKFGVLREKLWTQESHYAENPENLGSYVYANRMGNGDEASKDGYKYRGRGMLQVTGKFEYQRFTTVHNQKNPADIKDFVDDPDLLVSSIEYGVESAFVFWFTKSGRGGVKLFEIAQNGSVADVTQLVNGGQNGYADRNSRFQALVNLMGI